MKKIALILVILLIGLLAWGLIQSGNVSLSVNGQEITGPMKAIASGWGILVAAVVLFCVAILLAFVLAGVALAVLGVFVLAGVILAAIAFPFLLPLLIPLFIVWVFIAIIRR